jgi:hypothetical protein
MASLPREGRDRARAFARGAGTCGLSLGVSAPVAGVLVGAALAGPLAFACALAGVAAWKANELANDPPAFDYTSTSVIRPLPLDLHEFPASRPGRDLARLTASYAYSAAALRAFERAQGAAIRGREDAERKQLDDAGRLARIAASSLDTLRDDLRETRRAVDASEVMSNLSADDLPRSLEFLSDDRVMAFLYRGRLPIRELYRGLEGISIAEAERVLPSQALDGAVEPARRLAEFLRSWQPELPEHIRL